MKQVSEIVKVEGLHLSSHFLDKMTMVIENYLRRTIFTIILCTCDLCVKLYHYQRTYYNV